MAKLQGTYNANLSIIYSKAGMSYDELTLQW